MKISKTQIDKLGERLKSGSLNESDIRALDDYRRSYTEAYETVVRTIRDKLKLEPTGRPAKSTSSITEKLLRESVRLSQIQDIAGCRIVVADIMEQESVIKSLSEAFPKGTTYEIDRRKQPSHGYRAVHIVVQISGKLIEIQIRSALQHSWAEFSEKLSDKIDPKIKYGGGKKEIQEILTQTSEHIATQENNEGLIAALLQKTDLDSATELELKTLKEENLETKKEITNRIAALMSIIDKSRNAT
jgi:ppGpp synthetase/RelA/SpoT-type nucleotidyltranferase